MAYKIQFVYILAVLGYHGEFVDSTSVQSYLKVEFDQRDVNLSIISSTFSALSLMQCAFRCTRQSNPSLYFIEEEQKCHCNNGVDTNSEEGPANPEIVYGYTYTLLETEVILYKDCLELYEDDFNDDGVYKIHPVDNQTAVDVWCDMTDGGWTVFQRRQDGTEDFYRGWSAYVYGFGNKTGEYWLGLDNLHALTSQQTELHIYMETFEGVDPISAIAHYMTFSVDGPSMKYRLHWDEFTGSCGAHTDSNLLANGMNFTTFDSDNDALTGGNCAVISTGAWWYNSCWMYNLNGRYTYGNESGGYVGIFYQPCWGALHAIKTVIMKLRRLSP